MNRIRLFVPALMLLAAACAEPQPQTPLIAIGDFFDNPEIAGGQISPDGEWLSYLKPYEGKLNIYVKRFGSDEERLMTMDTVRPVTGYFWAVDSEKLLYVQDKGGNENFHIYSVPLEGEGTPEARDLTPFEGARAMIFDVPRELPNKILIGLNRRNPSAFDTYWLDIESGDLELVAENPGRLLGALTDSDHKVRVALGQGPMGETEIHFRETEDADWQLVASYPASENVNPIRIHPDDRRLYMSSDHGETDLQQLVLLDLNTGESEVLESDPEGEVDFGQAMFSEITDELIATVYVGDTVRIYPKTDEAAKVIADLRVIHDGTPNITSMTLDEKVMIASFDSPTDPGATYRYDSETGEHEFLYRPRPWLNPEQLADMKPVSYTSRDGLTIHGYLSTPRGANANLPLVLVVHGGPWARDYWGYNPEAQLLANRGYAVLQINFRGSTGYGKAFYNAAVKEWAGAMHDDLIDGVKWAIAEGIADPDKVAIYGGSYGGYATLVGVSWRPFLESSFYRHVGDPAIEEDRQDMEQRSPLFFVDQIEDPLLIVQGQNDPRVKKREADQLAIALRDRGITVDYILAENEGHGFANADNRLALYRSMEKFLSACLGGRVEESVDPGIEARIIEMTVDVDTLTLETE
jgi:dipeptidyl aminopeptidase/acylaminoacyl peptidase